MRLFSCLPSRSPWSLSMAEVQILEKRRIAEKNKYEWRARRFSFSSRERWRQDCCRFWGAETVSPDLIGSGPERVEWTEGRYSRVLWAGRPSSSSSRRPAMWPQPLKVWSENSRDVVIENLNTKMSKLNDAKEEEVCAAEDTPKQTVWRSILKGRSWWDSCLKHMSADVLSKGKYGELG